MRLDNVVYRLGLASSRDEARQVVNHGHIEVNDRKVDIPSYEVKQGDIVKLKKGSTKKKKFKDLGERLKKHEAPAWLHLDKKELSGKVLHAPDVEEQEGSISTQMIVEHYSK